MSLWSRSCLLLLLGLLVPASIVTAECTYADECEGQPDCTGCAENDLVPDPDNCRSYYVCIDGTAPDNYYPLTFDCEDGQVFNGTTRQCEEGDTCEPCSSITPGGSCTYECLGAAGLISSLTNCNNYYECDDAGDIANSLTCDAETPFFNGVECQTDETQCCHCQAYCFTEDDGKVIPDPLDCRRFYLCTAYVDIPTISGTCEDGTYFDSFLQGCSASAPCVQDEACTNVVGADGCIDPFTCKASGFFARCPGMCEPDYYHCTEASGEYQAAESCFNGTVFHPDSHTCVTPDDCP